MYTESLNMSRSRKYQLFPFLILSIGVLLGILLIVPSVKKLNFTRYLGKIHKNEALKNALLSVGAKYEGEESYLVSYNPQEKIHPGSNFKLFTAAAALKYLGEDFTFQTRLYRFTREDKKHLLLVGYGDPSLEKKQIEKIAGAVKPYGKITGDIFYDNRYFEGEKFGPNWKDEWKKQYFAVPITALQINDNLIDIYGLVNDKTGQFEIITEPVENFAILDRRTVVSDPTLIKQPITAVFENGKLALEGDTMKDMPFKTSATMVNPSEMTALVLQQELLKKNLIGKESKVLPLKDESTGELVFEYTSKPLKDLVFSMLKFSKNNYGETLVRTIGKKIKGQGSQTQGVSLIKDFVAEIGIPEGEFIALDGSGLSPQTRVSANALLKLFSFIDGQDFSEIFWHSLPESKVDGTLKHRFQTAGLMNPVIAKTGTHEFSSSLSGKIIRERKKNIIFSIHIMNHPFSTEESVTAILPIIDRIVALLDKQF